MTLRAEATLLRVCPATLRRWRKGLAPRSHRNRKHWWTYRNRGPNALRELFAFEDDLERALWLGNRQFTAPIPGHMEGIYRFQAIPKVQQAIGPKG